MNRRPIAAVMIAVGVLASGCVSRRAYTEKSDQAIVLSGALAEEQERTATLRARARELERQRTDDSKRIAALTTERDRLAGERQTQEARAQELTAQLEAASSDLTATRQALEDTRGQLTAAQQALETTRGQLAAMQQDLAATIEARNRFEAERQVLTAELSGAGRKLTETLSQLEVARRDLDGVTQGLAATRSELENARQALAQTTAERDQIIAERNQVAAERDQTIAERNQVATERDQVAAERQRLEAEARDLAAQLSATRDDLAAASNDLTATRQALAQAQGEVASTRQALAQAQDEAASTRQALSGTQGKLASIQQSLGETKEEMEARERKLRDAVAAYDKLVKDLRQEIDDGQVQISRLQDQLTVKVLDRILFDSGSARIKPGGQQLLRKVADTVRDLPDQNVRVEGHTDNVPIKESYRHVFPTNWELSTARATGVARFLQEKGSVDPKGLAAVGFGEYRPVQPNDTPDGRTENRRIEIVLVPVDQASR